MKTPYEYGYEQGHKDAMHKRYTGGMGSGYTDPADRDKYREGYEVGETAGEYDRKQKEIAEELALHNSTQGQSLERLRSEGWSVDNTVFAMQRGDDKCTILKSGHVVPTLIPNPAYDTATHEADPITGLPKPRK